MRFLHTSDLHIGKKIFETSLLEEQRHMLKQIFDMAVEEAVEALVIAGDIYDRSMPATEAVMLLDEFLTWFSEKKIPVIMISGNHDSPERVGFADRILEKQGIYIAGRIENKAFDPEAGYQMNSQAESLEGLGANCAGSLRRVVLEDTFGKVVFVCLPFVKPGIVECSNCAEAVARILDEERIDFQDGSRYVLVTHYFVTGQSGQVPELSESETGIDVGGIDNVPAHVFDGFAYVALGHIHKAQQIGNGNLYYSGAPMQYSFAEAGSKKGVYLVDMRENGQAEVSFKTLMPLHQMRCVKGKLAELIREDIVNAPDTDPLDYIQATLTDRDELVDPMSTLRSVYPHALQILLEKNHQVSEEIYESRLIGERKGTEELFADFYEMLTGSVLDDAQLEAVREAAGEAEACL